MSRPKNPSNPRDRSRKPIDITPVLVRRTTLARAVDCTEGWIRQLNDKGDGPVPIRIGKVTLYDLNEAIQWFKRNQTRAA